MQLAATFALMSLIGAATFAAAPVFAQAADPASAADRLGTFVGDATCTGHFAAVGKTPGGSTGGSFHGEKTLDGHWISVDYRQDPSAGNPKPFEVIEYLGFDPASQRGYAAAIRDKDGNWITLDEEICEAK